VALKAFLKGVESNNNWLDGCFAFHGTPSVENVKAICHGNLDVNRRNGQVHGPGEYFGVTSFISKDYERSLGTQIVFYLLKGHSRWKRVGEFCYVVNNTGNDAMLCLPVCVVHYRPNGSSIPYWSSCPFAPPRISAGAAFSSSGGVGSGNFSANSSNTSSSGTGTLGSGAYTFGTSSTAYHGRAYGSGSSSATGSNHARPTGGNAGANTPGNSASNNSGGTGGNAGTGSNPGTGSSSGRLGAMFKMVRSWFGA
jgi:hypothetical protein